MTTLKIETPFVVPKVWQQLLAMEDISSFPKARHVAAREVDNPNPLREDRREAVISEGNLLIMVELCSGPTNYWLHYSVDGPDFSFESEPFQTIDAGPLKLLIESHDGRKVEFDLTVQLDTKDPNGLRKFQHDCNKCFFLGHFFNHDVYLCNPSLPGPSIIARRADDGPDYASTQLEHFLDQINSPGQRIGVKHGLSMPFREYLFSEYATPYHKAWLLALSINAAKSHLTPE